MGCTELDRQSEGPHGRSIRLRTILSKGISVAAHQQLGDRKTQEDRFTATVLDESKSRAFFGVYDGTVGDFASENVSQVIADSLVGSEGYRDLLRGGAERELFERTMRQTYAAADAEVLSRCAREHQHYAACTSATVLLWDEHVVVSWIGDSRVAVGVKHPEGVATSFATADHRPDDAHERARIEAHGGTMENLKNHGNKPYIRGGDFMLRKALKEKPMQLQYSRAFGGKDLKMFGLTCEPMSRVYELSELVCMVVASDGVWDVLSEREALQIALRFRDQEPAMEILREVLTRLQRKGGKSDNITATVLLFP